jgi:pimeloyl-ACP methyl ester carboxylesterase
MPKNKYLKIDGKRIEAVWHGPPPDEAMTLVFLHEGLGCVEMWHEFPARLAEVTGFGALVFSRLGYGRSDPCDLPRPIEFMHHEGLRILPQVLEAARIEKCILIGHSDGGSISLIYAGGTPAKPLTGLITLAAHVFCEDLTVKSIQSARDRYLYSDLKPKLTKYHGKNVDYAFWGWNDVWLHSDFIHWNIEEYLPNIQVPLLAIQGEDDPYGTPAQVEAIVNQTGEQTESLMLSNCAHSPHVDRDAATLIAMRRFILKLESTC